MGGGSVELFGGGEKLGPMVLVVAVAVAVELASTPSTSTDAVALVVVAVPPTGAGKPRPSTTVLYCPGEQLLQCVDPTAFVYLPAGHIRHGLASFSV